jgi:hypothetical protein
MNDRVFFVLSLSMAVCANAQQPPDFKIYYGNLHSHTSYSDGSGKPDDAYHHARFVAGLDFLAITEHNHAAAEQGASQDRRDGILIANQHSLYTGPDPASLIPAANRHTENGKFIALYGQEFSSISAGNHVNVFDVPEVIDAPNGKFDALLQWIKAPAHFDTTGATAILQFNHPKLCKDLTVIYGTDDFGSRQNWIQQMGEHTCLIEVLNGPAMAKGPGNRPDEVDEDEYIKYLGLGFRVAPTGDQDNHYFTWGSSTDARTAILAKELTKPALLDAIRARHVYATEDKNLHVLATVNGHIIGDQVAAPAIGAGVEIKVWLHDDDEPDANYVIDVFAGTVGSGNPAELAASVTATQAAAPTSIPGVSYSGGLEFFFLRITQEDEDGHKDRAWTAPVWLDPGTGGGVTPLLVDEFAACVASKNSKVYHVSGDCEDAKHILPQNLVRGKDATTGRTVHQGCPRQSHEDRP